MKKPKPNWPMSGRIEEIEWTDHAGGSGWSSRENYEKDGISHCRSVGYVLREDARQVTLMQSMDSTCGKIDSSIHIAKRMIRSRRVLRKEK